MIHKVVTDWVTTNPIRVAVSPVSSGVQLQAPHCYETDGRRRFSITGLNDPDYVRRRVRASYKQNPFLYHDSATGKDYLEDLEGKTKVIRVIHIPSVGRLTFPICKDCLVEPYRTLLVRRPRRRLFVPRGDQAHGGRP